MTLLQLAHRLLPGSLLLLLLGPVTQSPARAQQVQLRCDGTLLQARGSAERRRSIARLRVSLALSADAADADRALAVLQERLAAVRSALQRLGVQELEVGSPSTWTREASRERPAGVEASLSVGGRLEPARLQALIREVGTLPGVRLAPVTPEADQAEAPEVRRALLRAAYQDALRQARELTEAIGRQSVTPLEVEIIQAPAMPMAVRGMDAAAAPPFDPAELPPPTDSLMLQVRFCSR
jgi:uncharacterized protein YggE